MILVVIYLRHEVFHPVAVLFFSQNQFWLKRGHKLPKLKNLRKRWYASIVVARALTTPGMRTVCRTQTVEGGRCVLLAKTCGHATEVDTAVDMLASSSPSQATENDNKQRNSKYFQQSAGLGVILRNLGTARGYVK